MTTLAHLPPQGGTKLSGSAYEVIGVTIGALALSRRSAANARARALEVLGYEPDIDRSINIPMLMDI